MDAEVVISGHKKEDPFSTMVVDKQVRNEISRLENHVKPTKITIHIDRYKESGSRVKYSIKAKLETRKEMLTSSNHDWDISKAIRGAMDKLESEARKLDRKKTFK